MNGKDLEPAAWVADEEIWDKAKKAAAKYHDEPYYWATVAQVYKNMGGTIRKRETQDEPAPDAKPAQTPHQDPESQARKIIIDNPDISASTLLNTIKSQGLSITKQEQADSASAFPQVTRPQKKESKAAKIQFVSCRLSERAAADDGIGPTKFRSILIEEGLGNLKDTYYYTREALESAVPIFEGKKIYADHPSSDEERIRPERSVRDVLGYFESVQLEEDADGRAQLVADVQILDEPSYAWARGLMRHAVDYSKKFPDKDFIGLSINANGQAEEVALSSFLNENEIPESALSKLRKAKDEGVDTIRIVSAITDAVSCDLVTEAGAGGRVMALIEQERKEMVKKDSKKEEKKTQAEDTAHVSHVQIKSREADDGKQGHDDAAKDEELFNQLLKKYMGESSESDPALEGMVKEAYGVAKEAGMGDDEAMKNAVGYAKMAKVMGEKKAKEAEAEAKKAEEACPPPEDKKEASADGEAKKESASPKDAEIMKLKGELASLKEKLTKIEIESYLDEKLAETKLRREHTKQIREAIGPVKSREQVDGAIKNFMAGYKARGEASDLGLTIEVEKVGERESGISFSDCTI